MARDDDIFGALFGGAGGSSRISPDLDQVEKLIAEEDYYRQAAAPILGAKFDTSTWSPGETLGVTAGQAFLGSLLNLLGKREQGNQLAAIANILPELYRNPESALKPDEVNDSVFRPLQMSAIKEKSLNRNSVIKELFGDRPELAVKALGLDIPNRERIEAPEIEIKPSGLASGRDTTAQKIKDYYQQFVASGMPATQAATSARQQVQGEIKASTQTFDAAKEAREYGQKLLDLASTAQAGVSEAGVTGSFNTVRRGLDYLASSLGRDESTQRLTGEQVLSSIAPEFIKMNRSPGAVSDYESKLYLGGGPTGDKTPEANAIIIRKMQDLGKLNLDYADFIDAYREVNGTSAGADKKWSQYRQAFPLFSGEGENIQLNSNRPSWQEYFNGETLPTIVKPDLNSFIAEAKKRGLTKEQARAEWQARGGE